ncbi:hypothetical protein [Pseudomonas sp. Irchel s3a18]|uniref:hypothetical protein n=1 Tax=Pseudomonas sp. Irchel s3a18 TaxID=2009053 RepID=UPI000BA439B2|nr:hypothetical protein [Pseudomonas sp. Irchel s3a18]
MPEQNESERNLQVIRHSALFRWAQAIQWFGIAMFLLAIGLALFTDIRSEVRGITLIAVLGMLGLLSLVPARFILTVYLMSPSRRRDGKSPPSDKH